MEKAKKSVFGLSKTRLHKFAAADEGESMPNLLAWEANILISSNKSETPFIIYAVILSNLLVNWNACGFGMYTRSVLKFFTVNHLYGSFSHLAELQSQTECHDDSYRNLFKPRIIFTVDCFHISTYFTCFGLI